MRTRGVWIVSRRGGVSCRAVEDTRRTGRIGTGQKEAGKGRERNEQVKEKVRLRPRRDPLCSDQVATESRRDLQKRFVR